MHNFKIQKTLSKIFFFFWYYLKVAPQQLFKIKAWCLKTPRLATIKKYTKLYSEIPEVKQLHI